MNFLLFADLLVELKLYRAFHFYFFLVAPGFKHREYLFKWIGNDYIPLVTCAALVIVVVWALCVFIL